MVTKEVIDVFLKRILLSCDVSKFENKDCFLITTHSDKIFRLMPKHDFHHPATVMRTVGDKTDILNCRILHVERITFDDVGQIIDIYRFYTKRGVFSIHFRSLEMTAGKMPSDMLNEDDFVEETFVNVFDPETDENGFLAF